MRSARPDRPSRTRPAPDEALFGVTRVLTFAGSRGLTTASGFFFERDGRLYLVTSRHVLFDAPSGHAPDRIEIELHTDPRDLTQLATMSILLYRDGLAVWHQAKDSGGEVDVAALQLDRSALPAACVLQPFGRQHLPEGFDRFEVGDRLAIPGFPLGFFDAWASSSPTRACTVAAAGRPCWRAWMRPAPAGHAGACWACIPAAWTWPAATRRRTNRWGSTAPGMPTC